MGGPIGKTTFAHNEPIGLLKAQKEGDPITYDDPPVAIIKGAWGNLAASGLVKILAEAYGASHEEYQALIDQQRGNVRQLHVYDLGDGMLVPCQLVRDLFAQV